MNIIKKSILPLVISFNAVAESPPEITIPPLPGFQYYATVDKDSTPYSIKARKDYSVKLSNCGASLIAPSWVITAGHCITRAKQSNPKTIRVRFTSKNKDITFRRATKVYKHKYRDLALIQLKKQASYNVQPILLLKDNISPEDGYIKIKKVYNQRLYPNITTRSTKKSHNLYVSKSERKGKAGSSGSPWVYKSLAGDVLVGVTHGSGFATQVSNAKRWINNLVSQKTPNEQVYFIAKKNVLNDSQYSIILNPSKFNSYPLYYF